MCGRGQLAVKERKNTINNNCDKSWCLMIKIGYP